MNHSRIANDKPLWLRRSLTFVTDGISRRYSDGRNIGLELAEGQSRAIGESVRMRSTRGRPQRNVLLLGDLCCASLRDSRWSRLAFGKFFEVLTLRPCNTHGSRRGLRKG